MAKELTGTEFSSVGYHANRIVEAASAAYWLETLDHDQAKSYMDNRRRIINEAMEGLADLMGVKLVDKEGGE